MTEGVSPIVDATEEPKRDTSKEWSLDAGARRRIDAALEEVAGVQEISPACVVCGQKSARLDKSGACSKTTEPHRQHRNEMRVKA